ncbi:MAG: EamA family transporter [Acetobacteraceae bacterium]|nr:EamA family transporter [Acetobacteraceae bacterium]
MRFLMQPRILFAILCLVWGTTWLALKTGAMNVPPALFSGTRWLAAGIILLVWHAARGGRVRLRPHLMRTLVLVALTMIALNQALMMYAMRYVGSGLAAVINSALTPIALLGFAIALGQERFSLRQALGIALGIAGLLLLFGPAALSGDLDLWELLGAVGVAAGCVSYCAGSVLARPLMHRVSPIEVAATTNVIGGAILLIGSLAFEPGSARALTGGWGTAALTAWIYLLLMGSLGATIIYLQLVRDWGASRTGTYAFISPVIAVVLGLVVYSERLRATDAAGMALMLAAAGVLLGSKKASSETEKGQDRAKAKPRPSPPLRLNPAGAGRIPSE